MDRITHFSHPHPLELVPITLRIHNCGFCGTDITEDEYYQCSYRVVCSYSLHTSCAKYSENINHPFHPQHTLIYKEDKGRNGYWRKCGACGIKPYMEFGYFCMDCKYALHLMCAALKPIGEFPEQELPHVIHQHSLLECVKTPWDHFQYLCGTCGEDFQDYAHIYVCQECPSLMHKICARLPNDITHPFHLQHPPLKLTNITSITESLCNACGEHLKGWNWNNNAYQCSVCDFTLDIHCAFLIPISNTTLIHLHPHPLIECQGLKSHTRRQCNGCNQTFQENSVHVCLQCSILLDTPCINACIEIYHPLHPQHRLILRKGYSKCYVCRKYTKLFYSCSECDCFSLDLQCSRAKINFVHLEIHKHVLAYFDFKIVGGRCGTCREWCDKFVFHCIECDLYIHDHCVASLPQTIKHECHCDPLNLSRSGIRDYPEQKDIKGAEFYCCACEQLREFDQPTYYCAECHFVAHVHCVISEIISYLQLHRVTFHEVVSQETDPYADYCDDNTIFLSQTESSQNPNTEDDSNETDRPHAAEPEPEPEPKTEPEPETESEPGVPVSQQLNEDITLLQKEVNALAAEISELTAKVDELKQTYSQRAESLEKKLLERNMNEGGHDQTLQPALVSGSLLADFSAEENLKV